MLKVYYTKTDLIETDGEYRLSQYRIDKLSKTQNEKLRKEGIAADLLLQRALGFLPEIRTEAKGKPVLCNSTLHFNLSHSGSIVACAVSDAPVGVDAEMLSKKNMRIADRFFSENELKLMQSSKDSGLEFLKIWCRKESMLKKIGCGLSIELSKADTCKKNDDFIFSEYINSEFLLVVCSREKAESFDYIELL